MTKLLERALEAVRKLWVRNGIRFIDYAALALFLAGVSWLVVRRRRERAAEA